MYGIDWGLGVRPFGVKSGIRNAQRTGPAHRHWLWRTWPVDRRTPCKADESAEAVREAAHLTPARACRDDRFSVHRLPARPRVYSRSNAHVERGRGGACRAIAQGGRGPTSGRVHVPPLRVRALLRRGRKRTRVVGRQPVSAAAIDRSLHGVWAAVQAYAMACGRTSRGSTDRAQPRRGPRPALFPL